MWHVPCTCCSLQALDIAIDLGPEGIRRCLDEAGIAFMYAPRYHPAMKAVRPVRSALKVGAYARRGRAGRGPLRHGHEVADVGAGDASLVGCRAKWVEGKLAHT